MSKKHRNKQKKVIEINIIEKRNSAYNELEQVIQVLKEHNIAYWIEHGTLLGAARENSVIPWDIEFDLGVWHSDYSKIKDDILTCFKKKSIT